MTKLDYTKPNSHYRTDQEIKEDLQADMLASALLIPKKEIELLWVHDGMSIEWLADYYNVPNKCVATRLEMLGLF